MNVIRIPDAVDPPGSAQIRSFDDVFRDNYPRIARLIFRIVGSTARAEELAAEVLWTYCRKPPPDDSRVEGWLCRTAMNLAFDALRRDARRLRYESASSPGEAPLDPETSLLQAQEAARVRSVLAVLNRQHSELLVLRSHGSSYAEIARDLSLNPASVGTMLARAEAAFRKEYVARYGERR